LSNVYFLPEELVFPSISIPKLLKLNAPFYPNFNVHQFYDFLKELDVEASSKLNDISFGQQKKVMIAFGLACNTRLLIMDEPTNGLDIPSKSKFRKLVAASISDERLFIISTHQVRDLESLIDQVIIMNDSKVVLKASTEEIGQKLSFKTLDNPQEEVLYAEESILGRVGVVLNMEEQESKINLEHLFGAVMNKGSLVRKIFSK